MTRKLYSHLLGDYVPAAERPAAARRSAEAAPKHDRAPAARPSGVEVLASSVKDIAEYLKLEPAERARREAQPLIEQERAEHTRAQAEAKAREEAAANAHTEESARLRNLLVESDAQRASLQAEVLAREAKLAQAAKEAAEVVERYRQELEAARRTPPQPLPALLQPQPTPAPDPSTIEFEYRKDLNGLLKSVLIQSPGYTPLVVEVIRGADNRLRHLKARNP